MGDPTTHSERWQLKWPAILVVYSILILFTSCATSSQERLVRATSLAYLQALERTSSDLGPHLIEDSLQWFQRDNIWYLRAHEVPLELIIQHIAPQIPLQTLPPSWIGVSSSVAIQGDAPLSCLQQLVSSRGSQLHLGSEGVRIVDTVATPPTSNGAIAHVITLQHIPTDSLQQVVQAWTSQGSSTTRIALSPETNQVVLLGDPLSVEKLARAVLEFDHPPALCSVQAWIAARLQSDEFLFQPQPLFNQGAWDVNLAALPPTQQQFPFLNGEISLGLLSTSQAPGLQQLQINALVSRIRQRAMLTPLMICLGGQSAKLYVGKTGWRLFIESTSQNSSSVTPQKIETGLTLEITPKVVDLHTIDLTLSLEYARFSPLTGQLVANKRSRSVSSLVRVSRGDLLRLSGSALARERASTQGLTALRNLPVLKWLFAAETRNFQDQAFDVYLTVDVAEPGRYPQTSYFLHNPMPSQAQLAEGL